MPHETPSGPPAEPDHAAYVLVTALAEALEAARADRRAEVQALERLDEDELAYLARAGDVYDVETDGLECLAAERLGDET